MLREVEYEEDVFGGRIKGWFHGMDFADGSATIELHDGSLVQVNIVTHKVRFPNPPPCEAKCPLKCNKCMKKKYGGKR